MTLVKSKPSKQQVLFHRKIHGLHHSKGKHYQKIYWPYLPILLIFGLGFFVNSLINNNHAVLGTSSNYSYQSLLDSTNNERQQYHLLALNLNSKLDQAAQSKASEMVKLNYWSHTSPSGQTPWSLIASSGYNYQLAAENLAYGFNSANQTVIGWMNSPEHRVNILNSNFTDVGFGVASSANYLSHGPEIIVVAIYAKPMLGLLKTNGLYTYSQPSISHPVSRIQLLTQGQASWSLTVLAFFAGILICLFVIRHYRKIKRILKQSEKFIFRHLVWDVILTFLIVASILLLQNGGIIR